MKRLTGGKGGAVGQSVPRFRCQECHGALAVVGVAERLPASGMLASSVQGSIMGTSRMDNSYVVLSKKNRSKSLGVSQRPLSSASPHVEPNQPTRPMECSYIMLPPPTASIYKASSSEDAAQLLPPIVNSSSSSPQNNSGFFSSVTVLKRAFEIATSQAQVEQPLCLECMRILSDKMDFEIEDINSDVRAYEACLQLMDQESYSILSETDFQNEKQKIEEEEKKLRADIEEAEKQYSEVSSEMKDLETKSKQIDELEERFGPANVLFSTPYDEAMTWFLKCLQEFVEFAVGLDKEKNIPPDKSLKLPYKIDNDKVGATGLS
nr:unnamed protein product [Digitaria exilis]